MRVCFDLTNRVAAKLLFGLVLFDLCLVLIFAVNTLLGDPSRSMKELFDLGGEGNIPAWFSSMQLFLIGLIFFLRTRQLDRDRSPSPSFLLTVSAGFLYLSVDEVSSIHEKITLVLKQVEFMPRFSGDHGIWIFIYALIALILFLVTFRAVAAMWNRYRRATLVMAVGVGIALLGGLVLEVISYLFFRSGSTSLLHGAEVALEEFLEMAGASVALYGATLFLLKSRVESQGEESEGHIARLARSSGL